MTDVLAEQLETEESMFVQTAEGIDSDGQTLTLRSITPSTLYFSDRPQRVVGHMSTDDFVDLWAIGDNSFEADPPNAVLSFLEPGADAPNDAVIVLSKPNLDGAGSLSYSIKVLDGNRSEASGTGHAVHRPVRTAALARLGVWRPTARAAAHAAGVVTVNRGDRLGRSRRGVGRDQLIVARGGSHRARQAA